MGIFKSYWFKYVKNFLIGMGAAFIIIGALFKIMHWEGANEILTYAMMGEAAIFALQAILPPDKDYYWEKYYPGLDDYSAKVQPLAAGAGGGSTTTVTELNKQLESANVNEGLIKRLGSHLNSLADNVKALSDTTNATGATGEYTKYAKEAAAALSKVKTAYENAATVGADLGTASEHTKKYQEQIQSVSKNLAALNAVYELELQDTNNHLKAMNKFYSNLTNAINNLNDSVEDTKTYRQQMANLSKNLSTLNNVYGNMLSAMAMGAKGQ